MEKEEILSLFNKFIADYNTEEKDAIWAKQSALFRNFWNNKILVDNDKELDDAEIDEVVRILDRNGKGNNKNSEAVAKAMIPQGAWRRMFNEIKREPKLKEKLNQIFNFSKEEIAALIDDLYKLNQGRHNNLTGQSGNAINAMLFAWDPKSFISVISLNDRKKVIEYFNIPSENLFEGELIGQKIIKSNEAIINGFRNAGLKCSPRTLSCFLYSYLIVSSWKVQAEDDPAPWGGLKKQDIGNESIGTLEVEESSDPSLFYMESQLEDFLIENWDKTELGKKYDLIEEGGELVSQQYQTNVGRIDILVKDKKTKQYVVIELKKNQTSDDTVGQLARYMGWIEENKADGEQVKGIIISAKYDERLYYALKKIKDTEVYLYKVNFSLQEFKKQKLIEK
ncbi:MAG: PDDEXK nuclease domain-containing protein [Candidatus Staskawiczbacteria bacterium]|nr:PDDEXK nuclease domain-containing protein [Candidatus Staskawiczbacteria bacterium]